MLRLPPLRLFLFECFLCFPQPGVFGVFGNLIVLLFPTSNFDIVFVRKCIHVTGVVKLRSASAAKHLMCPGSVKQFHLSRWAFEDRWQHDTARRQINSCGQRFGTDTNAEQFFLEQCLDDLSVARQNTSVMHTDAAQQKLPHFGTGTARKIKFVQARRQCFLLILGHTFFPLERLGHVPTHIAVKTKQQRGHTSQMFVTLDHFLHVIGQQFFLFPFEL